jgi:hypothetical protein
LLDSRAEENFISRVFIKQSGLLFTGEGLRIVKPFNNKEEIIYSIIHVNTKLKDTIYQERQSLLKLCVINILLINMVLGYP